MAKPTNPRIAKTRHAGALRVLRATLGAGELSAEQLVARIPRRVSYSHTWCACEDLCKLGLLVGHGQHADMAKGVPARYSIAPLGQAVASWT